MAAAWKYKAEDNATKPLVISLLMPLICSPEQSPHSCYYPKATSQRKKKKAALHENTEESKGSSYYAPAPTERELHSVGTTTYGIASSKEGNTELTALEVGTYLI